MIFTFFNPFPKKWRCYYHPCCLLCLFLLSFAPLGAQDTQSLLAEISALENDLGKLQQMLEESTRYQNEIRNKELDLEIKQDGLKQLKSMLSERNKQWEALQAQKTQLLKALGISRCTFRVHLGAYKALDLSQYDHLLPYFRVDKHPEGFQVFSICRFPSYFEAKNLSELLNSQGAATHVIGYLDDVWVPDLRDITDCTGF